MNGVNASVKVVVEVETRLEVVKNKVPVIIDIFISRRTLELVCNSIRKRDEKQNFGRRKESAPHTVKHPTARPDSIKAADNQEIKSPRQHATCVM